MTEVNKYSDFKAWASECAERGFRGPFKLFGAPRDSYQFLGNSGTAAMWNGENQLGSIFDPKPPTPAP